MRPMLKRFTIKFTIIFQLCVCELTFVFYSASARVFRRCRNDGGWLVVGTESFECGPTPHAFEEKKILKKCDCKTKIAFRI